MTIERKYSETRPSVQGIYFICGIVENVLEPHCAYFTDAVDEEGHKSSIQ